MKNASTKKANHFLNDNNHDLQTLLNKIKEIDRLNQKILDYLDPAIAPYCQIANITSHTLILVVANGSIATQLQYQHKDLLQRIKKDPSFAKIQHIQCKVRSYKQTSSRLTQTLPRKINLLSKETAQFIEESAQSLQDEALRHIMEKIAKHKG